MEITTLGIDLAKSVFQLHGVDQDGVVVLQKKLRRGAVLDFLGKLEPCLLGMEACPTSHFWAREIAALGHDVRLIPPAYVKPYVKRQKNDAADAEAICEAVTRPNMRFCACEDRRSAGGPRPAPVARPADAAAQMILNAIRAHLAEFGVITAQGPRKVSRPRPAPELAQRRAGPAGSRSVGAPVAWPRSSKAWPERSARPNASLMAWHRQSAASQRLETIPGVGIITATALAASVPDPSVFKSGRQFAAWLGLVPRQNSSGGKDRLGHVSKMGNGYLRRLLVVGATSVTRRRANHRHPDRGLGQIPA